MCCPASRHSGLTGRQTSRLHREAATSCFQALSASRAAPIPARAVARSAAVSGLTMCWRGPPGSVAASTSRAAVRPRMAARRWAGVGRGPPLGANRVRRRSGIGSVNFLASTSGITPHRQPCSPKGPILGRLGSGQPRFRTLSVGGSETPGFVDPTPEQTVRSIVVIGKHNRAHPMVGSISKCMVLNVLSDQRVGRLDEQR